MIIDFAKALFNIKKKQPVGSAIDKSLFEQLEFKKNTDNLTIGVETEFQLIDKKTLAPVALADEVQKIFSHQKNITPEMFPSIVEIITDVHRDAHSLEKELSTLHAEFISIAESLHSIPLASGCHPAVHFRDLTPRSNGRYGQNLDRFQMVMRQWIACGMHIHIGMKSERECMRFMNFFRYFIPHFIALSASSPFWQGDDTGLHSGRSVLNESLPTASLLHSVKTWEDMQQMVKTLESSGVIFNLKDLWWDLRPSCRYGTLELRMFDMPTNMQELKAIVAFVHTLAHWFERHGNWLTHVAPPVVWMARENKWRAMRYGLSAKLIRDGDGSVIDMRDDLNEWLERIKDVVDELGYHKEIKDLQTMMAHGTASERMRRVWKQRDHLQDIMRHVVSEFIHAKPDYPHANELPSLDIRYQYSK